MLGYGLRAGWGKRWRREAVYQTGKLNRCVDNGKCADRGPRVKKSPPCYCVFVEALLTSLKETQIHMLLDNFSYFGLGSVDAAAGNGSSLWLAHSITHSIHSLFLNFLPLSSKLSYVHFLARDCFMALSRQTANWASVPFGNFLYPSSSSSTSTRSICYSRPVPSSVLIA